MAKSTIFTLEDEKLVTAIEQRLCDEFPKEPLDERLKKAKDCAEKPVADKLRKLANNHKPPFHFVGFKGEAGFLRGQGAPKKGYAYVCGNRQFFRKQLHVTNPATKTQVEVYASRSLGTCTGLSGRPDIQLGSDDAYTLFGNKSLSWTEQVIIIPL